MKNDLSQTIFYLDMKHVHKYRSAKFQPNPLFSSQQVGTEHAVGTGCPNHKAPQKGEVALMYYDISKIQITLLDSYRPGHTGMWLIHRMFRKFDHAKQQFFLYYFQDRMYSSPSLSGHSQQGPPSLMRPQIFATATRNAFTSPSHQRPPL